MYHRDVTMSFRAEVKFCIIKIHIKIQKHYF